MYIYQSSSHKSAQKEKYLEYQKSLTPFFELQGVQLVFFPIFSYFLSILLFSPIF